jgi:small-conductance mechanosensitive channel
MSTPAPATPHHFASPLDLVHHISQWASDNWSDILLAVSAATVLYLLFEGARMLGLALLKRLSNRHELPIFTLLRRALTRTWHLFLVLAAARLVLGYIDPPRAIVQTITFAFTVMAVLQGARWLRAFIFGFIDLRSDVHNGGNESLANAGGLIRTLVNAVLVLLALVVILDNLNVNVTGLVAGLGIGGIAIGLAAQGIFSDLFASLSIIFDRPFRVGETINIGSGAATVERIGLKSTRLRAVTGERLIVSNAQLLNKEITSYAGLDSRRYTFPLALIYQTPPEEAARVPDLLRDVVEAQGGIFVRGGFIRFGASSLDFEVQFDIEGTDYDAIYVIRHRIGIALLKRLNEARLELAYPTQTTFTADPEGRMIMPYPAPKT